MQIVSYAYLVLERVFKPNAFTVQAEDVEFPRALQGLAIKH